MRLCLWLPWIALTLIAAPPAFGEPGAPEGEFDQIVNSITADNHEAACARMQAWVDAHPKDPQAPRGLIWMSKLRRADGLDARARPLLERTLREYAGTEWELHAIQGLADLDAKDRHYDRAIAGYDRLARDPSSLWSFIGQHAAAYARAERLRFDILLGLAAALVGFSLFRLWRAGGLRSLWPLPAELLYPLPLPLLMLAASTALEVPEGHTIVTLSLGGMALLWLNGAYLRARPPKGARQVAVQAALGVLQVCALLYCAVVTHGLWEKLVDTLAMGAE